MSTTDTPDEIRPIDHMLDELADMGFRGVTVSRCEDPLIGTHHANGFRYLNDGEPMPSDADDWERYRFVTLNLDGKPSIHLSLYADGWAATFAALLDFARTFGPSPAGSPEGEQK